MTTKHNSSTIGVKHSLNENDTLASTARRNLLLGLGAILGTSTAYKLLSSDAVSVALDYKTNPDIPTQAGKLLSKQAFLILREICDQVIPSTDTLGAAEVDVHGFIDNQLFACHTEVEQQQVIDVLERVNQVCIARYKQGFLESNKTQKLELLNDLEQEKNEFISQNKQAFKFLKGLIIFGYYTSEVGASQELIYLAIPGPYQDSIPLDSVRSSFAPSDF